MENLELKIRSNSLNFSNFNINREIEIDIDIYDNESITYISISPNQTNEIINHLAGSLKEINEPIELLSSQNDLLEALQSCMSELYTIHSQYGDKSNALENSNALRISEKAIEKAIK